MMKALKIGHIWRWVPVLLTLTIITLATPNGGHAGWLDPISDGTYTTYYWNSVSNPKFRYSFATTHQWQHYSKTNLSWYALSAAGVTQTFVGNGSWHDLGTGLKYRYDSSNDFGFYIWGASYRFYYRYLIGQWYTSGCGGGWYGLGSSGTNAGMLGAGFTSLGNGLSYHYNGSYDFGYYSRGSTYRFYYKHGVGQWYTSGYNGGWYELGTPGRNAGLAGASWTDLGTGLSYHYTGTYDFGYYLRGNVNRFYYRYGTGQWYQSGYNGGWYVLGAAGLTANQVVSGLYVNIGGSFNWQFHYSSSGDCGYWRDASNNYFAYTYANGQWWDWASLEWQRLGPAEISAQFIADGQNREFSAGDYFRYDGSFYYWGSGTADHYAYGYSSGTWWQRYEVGWLQIYLTCYDVDVRYIGGHKCVERYREVDPGVYAPSGYYDIVHNVQYIWPNSYGWTTLAQWTIHRPGTDNKWSGGLLNVMWCHSPDHNRGFAEYPLEDIIVFKYDMTAIGLQNMVNALSYVRDYYRTQISTVVFNAHGNATGWNIGEWIQNNPENEGYYGNYQAVFQQWANYMTVDGQIISYHCSSGNASAMLNQIAAWTTCDIFAHNHDVGVMPHPFRTEYSTNDPSIWNYNWYNMYMVGADSFEYRSNTSVTARIILYERSGW